MKIEKICLDIFYNATKKDIRFSDSSKPYFERLAQ